MNLWIVDDTVLIALQQGFTKKIVLGSEIERQVNSGSQMFLLRIPSL